MHPFDPTDDVARTVARDFGTPAYLYDAATLDAAADAVLAFGGPFGFSARFAVKACPNRAVVQRFAAKGLQFDASTIWEAERVLRAGVAPENVQITAQLLPAGFEDLVRRGVRVTACSLDQLERFGRAFPGGEVGVRINPGEGSGHNNRTNVAGPNASFGIWFTYLDDARAIAERHGVRITTAHHHVGSGGDPAKWGEIAAVTLQQVERLPDVTTVNLGGGFPVRRVDGDRQADLPAAAREAHRLLRAFAERTGRELHLEIEPGTYLAAHMGVLVGRVIDVVSTRSPADAGGRDFVKVDVGMAEILRPAMYGAQHPIRFLPADARDVAEPGPVHALVVVGPCCESGDVLTPARGDPEALAPRELPVPSIGDLAVVGATGAYCAGMAARNYNSIPAAPEILLETDGSLRLVRRRQTLDDVLAQECV